MNLSNIKIPFLYAYYELFDAATMHEQMKKKNPKHWLLSCRIVLMFIHGCDDGFDQPNQNCNSLDMHTGQTNVNDNDHRMIFSGKM